MPTISGELSFVSSRAAQVSEVWVRAPQVRTHLDGVVTTGNDRFPVKDGEVSFTAVPGPAVLALISQGRAVDTIPILVGDASTQTLRQVVSAAKVADDATQREIEKLAAQAVELVDSSVVNAKKAQDGATRAESAASNAKQSETNAASSAGGAKSSASAASASASKAASSEQNAAKSASSAAGSATSAKQDADRAAGTLDSMFWNGDRLAVHDKISPHLTGPKGDKGDQGIQGPPGTVEAADAPPKTIDMLSNLRSEASAEELTLSVIGTTATLSFTALVAPNSWTYLLKKYIPEQYAPQRELRGAALAVKGDDVAALIVSPNGGLTAYSFVPGTEYTGSVTWAVPGPGGPVGPKGDAGASAWADITGKPSKFPPESHKHKMADISDLPNVTSNTENSAVVQRSSAGHIGVPANPSGDYDATSRRYVDSRIQLVSSLPSSPASDVLYVITE